MKNKKRSPKENHELRIKQLESQIERLRSDIASAVEQAMKSCPDYPWHDKTASEVAYALCSAVKGLNGAITDWQKEVATTSMRASKISADVDKAKAELIKAMGFDNYFSGGILELIVVLISQRDNARASDDTHRNELDEIIRNSQRLVEKNNALATAATRAKNEFDSIVRKRGLVEHNPATIAAKIISDELGAALDGNPIPKNQVVRRRMFLWCDSCKKAFDVAAGRCPLCGGQLESVEIVSPSSAETGADAPQCPECERLKKLNLHVCDTCELKSGIASGRNRKWCGGCSRAFDMATECCTQCGGPLDVVVVIKEVKP